MTLADKSIYETFSMSLTSNIIMHLVHFLSLVQTTVLGLYLLTFRMQNLLPWDPSSNDVKVPVHLGVMSRCPDALYCEKIFDNVLKKVEKIVDLSLIYIAKYGEYVCAVMFSV